MCLMQKPFLRSAIFIDVGPRVPALSIISKAGTVRRERDREREGSRREGGKKGRREWGGGESSQRSRGRRRGSSRARVNRTRESVCRVVSV